MNVEGIQNGLVLPPVGDVYYHQHRSRVNNTVLSILMHKALAEFSVFLEARVPEVNLKTLACDTCR